MVGYVYSHFTCEGLVHTTTLSVSSYVHFFYCVWSTLFHWYLILLTHLNPEGRVIIKTSHLGWGVTRSLNICPYPIVGLYICSYLFYQQILWLCLSEALIMDIQKTSLEVILFLYSFRSHNSIWFSPRSLAYLVSVSCPNNVMHGSHHMKQDLYPNRWGSVAHKEIVPLLHQSMVLARHHCRSKSLKLVWCLLFFLLW